MREYVDRRTLPLLDATTENVAPFGKILGVTGETAPLPIDFYGGAMTVHKPVDLISDDTAELVVVTLKRRPLELVWIERHFKHTQTFIPLDGRPFIAMMAPPTDGELPDLDRIQALRFDGSAGFTLHIGTWHEFPFAVQDDTRFVVLLRAEATRDLMRDNVVLDEARGPDIDKKNLLRRTGILFTTADA